LFQETLSNAREASRARPSTAFELELELELASRASASVRQRALGRSTRARARRLRTIPQERFGDVVFERFDIIIHGDDIRVKPSIEMSFKNAFAFVRDE